MRSWGYDRVRGANLMRSRSYDRVRGADLMRSWGYDRVRGANLMGYVGIMFYLVVRVVLLRGVFAESCGDWMAILTESILLFLFLIFPAALLSGYMFLPSFKIFEVSVEIGVGRQVVVCVEKSFSVSASFPTPSDEAIAYTVKVLIAEIVM